MGKHWDENLSAVIAKIRGSWYISPQNCEFCGQNTYRHTLPGTEAQPQSNKQTNKKKKLQGK